MAVSISGEIAAQVAREIRESSRIPEGVIPQNEVRFHPANGTRITPEGLEYVIQVSSRSEGGYREVTVRHHGRWMACNCPGFQYRGQCSHLIHAAKFLERQD